jgi:antitoxin PrlF
MSEATLTSKGQTTIPKDIRDSLGLQPGNRMSFTLMPDGSVLLRIKNKSLVDLGGRLRRKCQKPLHVEKLSR